MSAPETRRAPQRSLRATVTGDVKTELDPTISGLPWGDSFTFGAGVDALTGAVTGSAVKTFTPVRCTGKSSTQSYSFIQDESELEREIEVAASGKYNIEGITLNSSTSYLKKIKYSELCITLVAHYEDKFDGYDEAPSYELTDQAKSHIGDPAKFRKAYGDYFVSGGRRGSLFTAVYTCQTTSVENMDEFKASFGADAPEVFTAEGSTRFMQAMKEHHVNTTAYVFLDGYSGNAPPEIQTPEEVMKSLAWFIQNEEGRDLEAKLRHYSTIDPNYPRTVDVVPDVFVELRQIYTTVWDVRAGYHSLPSDYQQLYKAKFTALDAGVMANQGILATDAGKRQQYREQADALLTEINDVYARMDFYYKVKSQVGTEPEKDKWIAEGTGQQKWLYGFSVYTKSKAVLIQTKEMHYSETHGSSRREHTFEFGPDGHDLIVGWEVVSNWNDGTNGWWQKAIDQILLKDHAVVRVTSELTRGFDWTLLVYYVDAKDYEF